MGMLAIMPVHGWISLANAVVDRCYRGECVEPQLKVKSSSAEVVYDADLITAGRQMQRRRPTAIPISTCMRIHHGTVRSRSGCKRPVRYADRKDEFGCNRI